MKSLSYLLIELKISIKVNEVVSCNYDGEVKFLPKQSKCMMSLQTNKIYHTFAQ